MLIKKGIPVSPGIAIFKAVVLDVELERVPKRQVGRGQVDKQLQRLDQALTQAIGDLGELRQQTANTLGDELAKIFAFHLGMLADETLTGQFRDKIKNERVTAEFAVFSVMKNLADTFLSHSDAYFKDRVSDIWDLERRILRILAPTSGSDLGQVSQPSVVIAHDLTPSQTASLDRDKIRAIATDAGGRTSHTAILAHALGIPAVVGLGDFSRRANNGDTVIIDGYRGIAIVEPEAAQLLEYRQEAERLEGVEKELSKLKDLPAVTRDGTHITLLGNIEFVSEVEDTIERGAEGIGLYRSEFLYLSADHEPSEEQQYQTYTQAVHGLKGRPLTIRTLDLGADKVAEHIPLLATATQEANPFLGCRSIRLCLQNLPIFRTQLRAILRASAEGPIQVMFPLISNLMEFRQAKMVLTEVMEDLDDQGLPFNENIKVGMMIEVPSAALQTRNFAQEADFFSIGTNDLVQYTVAVDRANERIASLYSAANPAVISLLRDVIRTSNRLEKPVSLCGEMAGQPEFTMLLLGLGLRTLSMTPPAIPEIKQLIRSINMEQCIRISRRVASFDTDRAVLNYLKDELNKVMPSAFAGRSIEI
jgi:phosphotransferase system enzyme I (PtsI)